jgi:hypothetical protein
MFWNDIDSATYFDKLSEELWNPSLRTTPDFFCRLSLQNISPYRDCKLHDYPRTRL